MKGRSMEQNEKHTLTLHLYYIGVKSQQQLGRDRDFKKALYELTHLSRVV